MLGLALGLRLSTRGSTLPRNVLTLNGQPLMLNGQYLTLGS